MKSDELYNATVEVVKAESQARMIRVIPDRHKLQWVAGQYGSLGIESHTRPGTLIKRPYSLSSSILDAKTGALMDHREVPYYEFYFNRVERAINGRESLTPRLFALERGARVFCGEKIVGQYTLEHIAHEKHVLLVSATTGESANNALVNQLLRERRQGRICHLMVGPVGWRSLYEAEHALASSTHSHYRYRAMTADSYQPLEEHVAACLRDAQLSRESFGFALRPETSCAFLCGDPAMIGAPIKRGAWTYEQPDRGLIPVLTAGGFTLSTRFKQGTITHETYW